MKPKEADELPHDLETLDLLLADVAEVHQDARGRDLQAAMGAIRFKAKLVAHREKLVAANAAGLGELSESEIMTRLEAYAARMPDPHLRIFVDVYCARLRMAVVPGEE
jgi:hypothetical protein